MKRSKLIEISVEKYTLTNSLCSIKHYKQPKGKCYYLKKTSYSYVKIQKYHASASDMLHVTGIVHSLMFLLTSIFDILPLLCAISVALCRIE